MQFTLKYPFEFRGQKYSDLTMRRPKTRDMRDFMRDLEKDSVRAYENIIGRLCEMADLNAVGEMDIEDFAPLKKHFEGFLKPMANDSAD